MDINSMIAGKIAKKLVGNAEQDSIVKISYLFEMLLSETEKIILISILFTLMGYGSNIVAVFFVIMFVRRYIGGNHCNSYIACLICSVTICGMAVLTGVYFELSSFFRICIVIVAIAINNLLAPVKMANRPVLRWDDVKKIKRKGNIGILLVVIVGRVVSDTIGNTLFTTLLLLDMDCLVAGMINGFYGTARNESEEPDIE